MEEHNELNAKKESIDDIDGITDSALYPKDSDPRNSFGVPMARVTVMDNTATLDELKKILLSFRGKPLFNVIENEYADINVKQAGKLISVKASDKSVNNGLNREEHRSLVAKIANIWKWAVKAHQGSDIKNHNPSVTMHKYVSSIRVNDNDYFAWSTVKQTFEQNLKLYSIEFMDQKKLLESVNNMAKDTIATLHRSYEEIIDRLNSPVNRENLKIFTQCNRSSENIETSTEKKDYEMDIYAVQKDFHAKMLEMGAEVAMEDVNFDGKPHRCKVEGDRQGMTSGFYVCHLDGYPAGYIMNNRTGESVKWKTSVRDWHSQAEHEVFKLACTKKREELQKNAMEKMEEVSRKVCHVCAKLPRPTPDVPYLQNKKINLHSGARTLSKNRNVLVLPAQDADGKLWTVQYILEDGSKRFAKDGRKNACFHPVDGMDAVLKSPAIIICEGYATACSIAEATGFGTISAFDSNNLISVAKAMRKKYPDRAMVIAGDDDRHLSCNVGKEHALFAAQSTNASFVFPLFANGENGRDFTDFNDMATKSTYGKAEVKRQIDFSVKRALELADGLKKTSDQNKTRGMSR